MVVESSTAQENRGLMRLVAGEVTLDDGLSQAVREVFVRLFEEA